MRVLAITSGTGQKVVSNPKALRCADCAKGADHLRSQEEELTPFLTPGRDLHTGQQHVRLMRGIASVQDRLVIDLFVLSAGYGLVPGNQRLAPNECTFTDRNKANLKAWATQLDIPQAMRTALSRPFDLGLLLLGDGYLAACDLDRALQLGGPTLTGCRRQTQRELPPIQNHKPVSLGSPETKRFSCNLVGLNGEITAPLLQRLADRTSILRQMVDNQPTRVQMAKTNPIFHEVINLPEPWHHKPLQHEMYCFVPERDDLVWSDTQWPH